MTGDLRQYKDGLAMMIGNCRWPSGGDSCVMYTESQVKWIVYRSKQLTRNSMKGIGRRVAATGFDVTDVAPDGVMDADYLWKHYRILTI